MTEILKRATPVLLLLMALWLLADNESNDSTQRHHLAVWTALQRHPPCLRIYRALLEFNLMVWGLAVSLWLWSSTIGTKMVGHLLFQPAEHDSVKDETVYFTEASLGNYRPVVQHEGLNEEEVQQELRVVEVSKESDADKEDSDDNVERMTTKDGQDNHDIDDDFEIITPPPAARVANVALDSLLLILVSLFLFTLSSAEGGRYVDGMAKVHTFRFIALIAAPIFPLLLFLGGCAACVLPWSRRMSQWMILSYTLGAPLYHVTFRDGFIGDILTSSVRPFQDVAFTVFYIFSGLQGWWKQSYDLDAADLPLESNWILHTMILPMCMVSPLWWRFLQNLQQTYEYKSRWPYLGNALKYFIAAEVAVFGVYMQSRKQSFLWLSAFVVATLYQIWWDIFMDWALLDVALWKEIDVHFGGVYTSFAIPTGLRLRKTRVYSVRWLYWGILVVNVVLRFCWTLSFLPPHYLNRAGVLSETFEGDLSAFLNPTIASAEIIRRMLWGWLRVEWEAIKVARKEPRLKGAWRDYDVDDKNLTNTVNSHSVPQGTDMELKIMAIDRSFVDEDITNVLVSMSSNSSGRDRYSSFARGLWIPRRMYDMTQMQILGELCIYATIFTGLGLMAAAHRETL